MTGFFSTSQATSRGKRVARTSTPASVARDAFRAARREQYDQLLAALATAPAGLTADDLDLLFGWDSRAHAGRRLIELVRAGEIIRTGESRTTRSGKPARVHVVAA